jgi:hypothetical protein
MKVHTKKWSQQSMSPAKINQQIPALGAFAILCITEALVALYGTHSALSRMPLVLAIVEFVRHGVPVAQRFAACGGPDGTVSALIAVSAIFVPFKALALFIAFPFTLQDTERLWSGYRGPSPGTARRIFSYGRRVLLLGLCAVPALFVFVGFTDDIETGRARHRQFCEGGLAAYPQWLMYAMFATVPCLVFFAAARSMLSGAALIFTTKPRSL